MGETKHTPGPLEVERHDIDDGSIAYEIWTADKKHRTARIIDDDNPRAMHDAMLYAAAPQMLEALRAAKKAIGVFVDGDDGKDGEVVDDAHQMINDAIAKAEGRS